MVYASGSVERMRELLVKSFKVTLGLTLLPLGFISLFGTEMVYAWTGQEHYSSSTALRLLCLAGLFNGFSMLQLVLYRASGRAIMDNLRQLLRIVILALIAVFGQGLGFNGVLFGLAVTELLGMLFMMFALTRTFHPFGAKALVPDAVRLTAAAALVLAIGVGATHIPLPGSINTRLSATLKLGEASLACLLMLWPALIFTKSVTRLELRTTLAIFFPRQSGTTQNTGVQ